LLDGRQLEAIELQIEHLPVLVRDLHGVFGGLQGVRGSTNSWTRLPSLGHKGTLRLLGLEDAEGTAEFAAAQSESPNKAKPDKVLENTIQTDAV
jgi:hypothetical protein